MDFLKRFSAFMAEALHCAGTPEGLALPLGDVQERLIQLAEEERSLPLVAGEKLLPDFSEARRQELEQCRFAVYAWADEQMLNSPRPDAAGWLALSLQCRYFNTTAAGRAFFARLTELFDGLGVPAVGSSLPGETVLADPAWRMERAVGLSPEATGMDVLRVFALCLLYGFRGCLFDQPDLLARLRKASHELLRVLDNRLPVVEEKHIETRRTVWQSLETAAYVLVPVGICLAFWLYCADILANVPFRRF